MPAHKNPIIALKQTRWWKPAVKRYAAHMIACRRHGEGSGSSLRQEFMAFASEVMNTPERLRDELLAMPPLAPYEPPVRYRAYDSPAVGQQPLGQQPLGFAAGKKKTRG